MCIMLRGSRIFSRPGNKHIQTKPTYVMLWYVVLCYVMLCCVMLCCVMLCYVMLCYVIWLSVKRLSQEAIQRRSQRDRQVKRKVFKLRRDAGDIPCSITLRSAGGVSFQSAGPNTAKARFWDREVREQ